MRKENDHIAYSRFRPKADIMPGRVITRAVAITLRRYSVMYGWASPARNW